MRSASREHHRAMRPRGTRPILKQYPESQVSWYSNAWGDVALPGVTETIVLGLSAAWRAVNLISNGVAAMAPPRMVAADGITPMPTPLVVARPNASMGITDFWHSAVAVAIMKGNFVGILADYDTAGWPRQIVPVHPDLVKTYVVDGYCYYSIGDHVYSADEVVHVRGYTVVGNPWGVGVVDNFRRSLGAQLDQQSLASATYKTGAVPSGVISVHRPEVTDEQATSVKAQWVEAHGSGQRAPAVLSEMFSFEAISWSPEDAQFLQSRQFSVAEIAFMFGLSPSDLDATVGGSSITYQNIQDQFAHRVTETLGPWTARFEDAWSDIVPGGNLVRFNRSNLLHANERATFESNAIGISSGQITVDEARAMLNRSPISAPSPLVTT